MIIDFKYELWKSYKEEHWSDDVEYRISNYGRVKKKKVNEDNWQLSPTSLVSGYKSFGIKKKGRFKSSSAYVHRLVAILFLERKEHQKFVIHLDFDKENNNIENLEWANKSELFLHHKKNPKKKGLRTYSKLTEGRVRLIKKKILDPNRRTRMRLIAKQFGISEMQLYRIKSGENWGSVKIDGEK
ncbi:HNH endonuclease signature motif containing protein [Lutibacter sp.]